MLRSLGVFSDFELQLFNQNIEIKPVEKNEILLSEGEISKSIFFIKTGALFQLQKIDDEEIIIDLNIQDDWVFNFDSLSQTLPCFPSYFLFTFRWSSFISFSVL